MYTCAEGRDKCTEGVYTYFLGRNFWYLGRNKRTKGTYTYYLGRNFHYFGRDCFGLNKNKKKQALHCAKPAFSV